MISAEIKACLDLCCGGRGSGHVKIRLAGSGLIWGLNPATRVMLCYWKSWNDVSTLERHGFHRDNKVDAAYVFSLQVGIVRDKQVDSGACRASQLHRVRGTE